LPYATHDGVRIHYEIEGDGLPGIAPVVCYHGFTGSLDEMYDFGYVEALSADRRLILIDARGHGASDAPHAPEAHHVEALAGDVLAVMDAEGLARPHFFGYSMGGRVGFGLARVAPERLLSLVIGGITPFAADPAKIDRRVATWRKGLAAIEPAMARGYGAAWTPAMRERFLANDLEAMVAFLAGLKTFDCEDVLPAMIMPCLLYAGENDTVFYDDMRCCASRVPGARWISLPDLSHLEVYVRSDLIVPHLRAFWGEVEGSL